MRNLIFKLILSCMILLSSVGCEDELTKLYQDPDGFSKTQADEAGVSIIAGYFTSQLTRGFLLRGDYGSHYHQLRSGSRVMGSGVQLYYTTNTQGVAYTLQNVENDWGSNGFNQSVFNQLNSNWVKQILWGQKEFNNIPEAERTDLDVLFMRLLHVLKAYAYQRGIDGYDEVPYFETGSAGALEGEKADFLGQEEIYPKIIAELGEIETYLSTVELSASDQTVFQSQDVIFDGNLMQWRKYINSLRLRWAMTVSERLPELTTATINELSGKPLFVEANDVAGLADIAIVEPSRLQGELGITRSFRERGDESRAPKRYLDDIMNCVPVEKSIVVEGATLLYFEAGSDCSEGLENGTVDPRIAYLFSKDILGRYVGAGTGYDNGSDPNSYFNKTMRAYYITHPIMTDVSVTEISFGTEADEQIIQLSEELQSTLNGREAFLLNAFRDYIGNYRDTNYTIGTNSNLISEFNTRPQYNFDIRYPTLHAVETELSLAEAAVRGFGNAGSARQHYARAIELSCQYWYSINVDNKYSKQTVPSFPSNMDQSRIDRDRPSQEYNAGAYAQFEAQRFDGLSAEGKVNAIFNQLQLHYNMFNFETPWTAARRLVNYLGDNPGSPYEIFQWKERFLYNPNIQATDPEAWARISQHDNPDIPVWFTGRDTKWKNVLE
ncbi:SusD/RagB family nutrient-binding outer membrane lipoprotein [Aurantibacter crassamenti]|uniref:SusD/RagB family nutrient-binding outer membrane lipoprotein n=1 Tax=Aurantibacter crassamenti TaxID=1837375 RepID=UPI00193A41E1|nr:SusD/RagB family nutrient-binding outer membrane lipoprotein [Aurantibacter crassamenti]MBM1106544.1 SusD/RagB family nutrient-binding outer membrane lipoprotein [Aurantibacter crassamenti]